MNKRLYRSRKDKMIAGVCGGLAEYFKIDPVILRVLIVVLTIGPGVGLLMYIILWIVVPEEPIFIKDNVQVPVNETETENSSNEFKSDRVFIEPVKKKSRNKEMILAVIFITVGIFWLTENIFPFFTYEIWLPLILITIGLLILFSSQDKI